MEIPKQILIVGGGTAGWMAASLMQHVWGALGTKITLVESAAIGTIGVGEGSTPYLRNFFRQLDIPEAEWMPACSATYKCGISFPGWSQPDEGYFHPFFSKLDEDTGFAFFDSADARRHGENYAAHPDSFFVSAALARARKSPIPSATLPFDIDYGYHFDAGLLGKFLADRAVRQGVTRLIDTVVSVEQTTSGDIAAIICGQYGRLAADLFVDCSGFAALLINKTLGAGFQSYSDCLFNDAAVALATDAAQEAPLPSETVSSALGYGWAWRIPLTNRFGNGYVYSSQHISADKAEQELRAHLGPAARAHEARHLKMRVGRSEQHWFKNCLAIGLSQGFIEPLEATALMLVQLSVDLFIREFNGRGAHPPRREAYNSRINAFFDGVRDYIVCHYYLNRRTDTDYWHACRTQVMLPNSLQVILDGWDNSAEMDEIFCQVKADLIYLKPSWYCLLAGMGRFPAHLARTGHSPDDLASRARSYCVQTTSQFLDHRAALAALASRAHA